MTDEEINKELDICNRAAPASRKANVAFTDVWFACGPAHSPSDHVYAEEWEKDIEARERAQFDANFYNTARTGYPKALRELKKAQDRLKQYAEIDESIVEELVNSRAPKTKGRLLSKPRTKP